MGIAFTIVFLCENVQLALMASPRISSLVESMFYENHVRRRGNCNSRLDRRIDFLGLHWNVLRISSTLASENADMVLVMRQEQQTSNFLKASVPFLDCYVRMWERH